MPTDHIATGYNKWAGGVAVGSVVYGIPASADAVLVFDTATEEVRGVPTDHIATGGEKCSDYDESFAPCEKWLGGVAVGVGVGT